MENSTPFPKIIENIVFARITGKNLGEKFDVIGDIRESSNRHGSQIEEITLDGADVMTLHASGIEEYRSTPGRVDLVTVCCVRAGCAC